MNIYLFLIFILGYSAEHPIYKRLSLNINALMLIDYLLEKQKFGALNTDFSYFCPTCMMLTNDLAFWSSVLFFVN